MDQEPSSICKNAIDQSLKVKALPNEEGEFNSIPGMEKFIQSKEIASAIRREQFQALSALCQSASEQYRLALSQSRIEESDSRPSKTARWNR